MADWLKDFQSMGRGIRNGELTVAISGTGKSVILDMESQGLEPAFNPKYMRHFERQHWCHNPETGKWTYHKTRPFHEYVAGSDKIIIRGEDDKFYWYKDRNGVTPRDIDEDELKSLTFVFIGAEQVMPPPFEEKWVEVLKNHAKHMSMNPCNEIIIK